MEEVAISEEKVVSTAEEVEKITIVEEGAVSEKNVASIAKAEKVVTAEDAEINRKRKETIKSINAHLKTLGQDSAFQYYVRTPIVGSALEIWGGKQVELTDDQMQEIKHDNGVQVVYRSGRAHV